MSEGQERVNTKFSLLPTHIPSLISEGESLASLFTFHYSLKKRAAFTLAEGAAHAALRSNQRKIAFTLAEVLITLGIIGVVAALTMPSLISDYKYKVLETQLKAAYSDLNQAAKLFQVHNGMSVSKFAASMHSSKETLIEFSKEFNDVIKKSDLTSSSEDDEGNIIGAQPYKWFRIIGSNAVASNCDASGFIWDTQGRVMSLDDSPNQGENGPKLCIDINGEKAPNRYGIDLFIFYVYYRRICYSYRART